MKKSESTLRVQHSNSEGYEILGKMWKEEFHQSGNVSTG